MTVDTVTIRRLLAIAALICAVVAYVLPGPDFLNAAVILLALALVV
jgi:hypothetical protein